MRLPLAITAFVTVAPGLVACGGGDATPRAHHSKAAPISVAVVPGLGRVLANGNGRTVYIFAPDKHHEVTCVRTCAEVWPPVKVKAGQNPTAGGIVRRSFVGSDRDPDGGRVLTYHGWPLYTYSYDTGRGSAAGQALKLNGGVWYTLSPSGEVIHKKPAG